MAEKPILPLLPYGEGNMTWIDKREEVLYKKNICGERISVYGKTPKECLAKMRKKEREIEQAKKRKLEGSESLGNALSEWHSTFKKPGTVLKNTSYDREHHTITNQILKYPIGNMQLQAIDQRNIQKHLNTLIDENYSYSTVKKVYELLNQFFNYYYLKTPYDNPMLGVNKPTKAAMNVEVKEVDYFDEEDILLFLSEASRKYYSHKSVYHLGFGLILLMFTGLRVNEALSLRWGDVDFDRKELKINLNRARVIDYSKPQRQDGTYVYKTIYTTPKTETGKRTVYLIEDALQTLCELREIQKYNSDDDFIFATSNGTSTTERNLRRTLNSIQEKAGMKVQNSGLHVLRHTFCSMLCRAKVDEGVVASLLGQKDREMVKKIYRHVSEHEKIEAVSKIATIDAINQIKLY